MANLTLSDRYGIGAVIGLAIAAVFSNPVLMLGISVLGILAGFWVVRQGEVRRVAFISFAAFVIVAVFAIISLVRSG